MTRIILRGLLGGLLGILMGENAFAAGLLSNPAFPGMLLWYALLFLALDFAITKYHLRDKQFFLLLVILGILIGGILDNEFLQQEQGQPNIFLGVAIDIAIINMLTWGVVFVLVFYIINWIVPRSQTNVGLWAPIVFTIGTIQLFGPGLPHIFLADPLGVITLLTLAGILFAMLILWVGKNQTSQDMRPDLGKSKLLALVAVLYLVIPAFSLWGELTYLYASVIAAIVILAIMSQRSIAV